LWQKRPLAALVRTIPDHTPLSDLSDLSTPFSFA
jgi:hypothetical protein